VKRNVRNQSNQKIEVYLFQIHVLKCCDCSWWISVEKSDAQILLTKRLLSSFLFCITCCRCRPGWGIVCPGVAIVPIDLFWDCEPMSDFMKHFWVVFHRTSHKSLSCYTHKSHKLQVGFSIVHHKRALHNYFLPFSRKYSDQQNQQMRNTWWKG